MQAEEEEYSGSEYSDDDSEDGEEGEEEEEEPQLKYQRLAVSDTLKDDEALCMRVHDKFLLLGTRAGRVYVLDFNGNEIKKLQAHSAAVNDLSVDDSGEHIASCSDDGKVVIYGLYTGERSTFSYHQQLLSVALDPSFSRDRKRAFCCGGRNNTLILNTKGFFRSSDTTIHSGEGPIWSIAWRGSLIAWANDIGVKVYDVNANQRITYINRAEQSPKPELYRCSLCWENDRTLLIGWADSVQIGLVTERTESSVADLPTRCVEIIAFFRTDFYISGIAPFGEDLILLAYLPEKDEGDGKGGIRKVPQRPELRIVSRNNDEVSTDEIPIHGYERLPATAYKLAHMAMESLFYIVTPKDIVLAKPRDLDDHVSWLIEDDRQQYDEALRVAEQHEDQLKSHSLIEIGERYLRYLLDKNEIAQAAALCPKILKRDKERWEKWLLEFARRGQLSYIGPYTPVGNPQLRDIIYEMVLGQYLTTDHEGFLKLIHEWPPNIYNVSNVINAVQNRLNETSDGRLMDALAKLYTYNRQYDMTLHIYLRLKRPEAFDLIAKYNLYDAIQDKVLLLMECNQEKAIHLFVNTDKIPVKQVVEQLHDHPILQHAYLHALFLKNPNAGMDYRLLQIKLYAQYDYKNLRPFLIQTIYPLEQAYKIVEERKMYPEMVHILGRMGNTKDALDLIIERIGDVKMAIDFVQEQRDEELWEDLISHSMRNPRFVSGLLENIGACEYVKPLDLIRRIPNGMEIVGLRDRLVKIISDYNLQMSLREGCNVILKSDCVDLIARQYKSQRRGLRVHESAQCPLCDDPVVGGPQKKKDVGGELVVFFCHHVYHSRCLTMAIFTQGQGGAAAPEQGAGPSQGPSAGGGSGTGSVPTYSAEELKYASLKSNQQELSERNALKLKGERLTCIICHQNKARQMRKQHQAAKGL